ncbi:hypothetical protein B5K03_21550 [Rhizobium phaseoli]|uniref:relaxase/mobilization nuclease domain-containing protein n=1 Tax=Rhizobium phaseoli TaxID=396 RepID=UPI000D67F834|nr:hypothetical protein [Rhizobium phaseoli]PWI52076.1 hypothetical protein B5K03_21550 [Rhizobium phaseoli]
MIVQATRISRQGGIRYLARHLLDKTDENDRIEVLAGDRDALHDAQALAEVKRCKFSVRHFSVSPEQEMSPAQLAAFVGSIEGEFKIGPQRPRLLVRHIKHGRAHFHLAVAEVDPATFRVLDCRQDFARLESLARRYEQDHGEHVQPSRAERREARIEGFSDTARKRAERTSPSFDKTRLKTAFAAGIAAFQAELTSQSLRITEGDKGAILVNPNGVFVAAACRAVGVRRGAFQKFIEGGFDNVRVIGRQIGARDHAGDGGTQHREASTSIVAARNSGRYGPYRATVGTAPIAPRHARAAGHHVEVRRRQARPIIPALTGGRLEGIMLARLSKDLDDILRRALELAAWIMSVFEPETSRLSRQIEDARRKRKSLPPPATAAASSASTYDLRKGMTP